LSKCVAYFAAQNSCMPMCVCEREQKRAGCVCVLRTWNVCDRFSVVSRKQTKTV